MPILEAFLAPFSGQKNGPLDRGKSAPKRVWGYLEAPDTFLGRGLCMVAQIPLTWGKMATGPEAAAPSRFRAFFLVAIFGSLFAAAVVAFLIQRAEKSRLSS